MSKRFNYHFEPKKGWMNDPNGLCFFKGQFHAFFQHNPYKSEWGPMHWGHCVSEDFIHWSEMPIALFPDRDYENDGGCWSGSSVEKDGKLYIFYTSVGKEYGQSQSLVTTSDCVHFEKHEGNPVIKNFPEEGSPDFRDPKVTKIGDLYYMVVASGKEGIGKILYYTSADLLKWDYRGMLFESSEMGRVFECPDFFEFKGKYILLFSMVDHPKKSLMMIYGDFDGETFTPISYHTPETGPHFYAPQTFLHGDGRRIIIGWMHAFGKILEYSETAGGFTVPREIKMINGRLCTYPVKEAHRFFNKSDELVKVSENRVEILQDELDFPIVYDGEVKSVEILRDEKVIEVFINGGEESMVYWFAP